MGTAFSISPEHVGHEVDEIAHLMMPSYYIKNAVVTEQDIILARASWKHITDGTSPAFYQYRASGTNESSTCLSWFYDTFYKRLFDVNPDARSLFKTNMQSQGRVLVGMISTALNQLKNPDSFGILLTELTHNHSRRGIRGLQYGIIGDVLFWSLHKCVGSVYDATTSVSWIKIFSYMLSIIVPIAVQDEIDEIINMNKSNKLKGKRSTVQTLVCELDSTLSAKESIKSDRCPHASSMKNNTNNRMEYFNNIQNNWNNKFSSNESKCPFDKIRVESMDDEFI